jgi:hypothetical protein
VTITSHTTLLETDYNLHKSNSTYFSDLDISRTALVTRLYTPGMELTKRELESVVDANGKRKFPGRMNVILGSVYCSFKKEIKPYERYEIQSKIIAWDEKWLYVLSFFLRPEKRKGEGKTLLAVAISQYVVKKDRLTVRPERVLRASGFLPPRSEGEEADMATPNNMSPNPSALATPASGEGISAIEALDESMIVREVLTLSESGNLDHAVLEKNRKGNSTWDRVEWPWERIEQERLRGLRLVRAFIGLDAKLHGEAKLR